MKYIRTSAIVIITYVLIAGIAIPIVPQPQGWFEFPVIPGLEEKARNIFFHVPTAWTTVVAFLTSMWYGLRYLRTRKEKISTGSMIMVPPAAMRPHSQPS